MEVFSFPFNLQVNQQYVLTEEWKHTLLGSGGNQTKITHSDNMISTWGEKKVEQSSSSLAKSAVFVVMPCH